MTGLSYMRVLALVFIGVISADVHAQDAGMSFLRIGTHARFAALGDSYTAYVSGPASVYGNPAGLAVRSGNAAALSYQSWIASTNIYSASGRFGVGERSGLGLAVTMFDSGDLEARDRPGPGDPFAVQFMALSAGYARTVGSFRGGITGKVLSERIYTENATGYALDAGLQATLIEGQLLLGASVHNVGSMEQLGEESTELPLMIRLGAAGYPLRIYSDGDGDPSLQFLLTPEVVILPNEDEQQFRLGIAADMPDILSVRAGYISGDAVRRLTFGAGILLAGLTFDYAFLPLAEGFGGSSHLISLQYAW